MFFAIAVVCSLSHLRQWLNWKTMVGSNVRKKVNLAVPILEARAKRLFEETLVSGVNTLDTRPIKGPDPLFKDVSKDDFIPKAELSASSIGHTIGCCKVRYTWDP